MLEQNCQAVKLKSKPRWQTGSQKVQAGDQKSKSQETKVTVSGST